MQLRHEPLIKTLVSKTQNNIKNMSDDMIPARAHLVLVIYVRVRSGRRAKLLLPVLLEIGCSGTFWQ